jgi:hypothetical protein
MTSKLRADASCRVTTPVIDRVRVTRRIMATARECVSFMKSSVLRKYLQTKKRPLHGGGLW